MVCPATCVGPSTCCISFQKIGKAPGVSIMRRAVDDDKTSRMGVIADM